MSEADRAVRIIGHELEAAIEEMLNQDLVRAAAEDQDLYVQVRFTPIAYKALSRGRDFKVSVGIEGKV